MMPRIIFVFFLMILATLGYFASDMYLPAFPIIQNNLHTSIANVELTLSVYLIGLAPGQIIYGIISDRIGRKSALAFGMALFALASVGCYYSQGIQGLLIWRVAQAFGACASSVLWQAMVVDRYGKAGSHRLFAFIFPLLGVSPALAPTLGSLLAAAFGWRSIFLTLSIVGCIVFCATIFFMRETMDKTSDQKKSIRLQAIFLDYKKLFSTRDYLGYVMLVCLANASFFAYLTGSPFAFKAVGFTTHQMGLSYVPQTFLFMLGGFLSKHLVDRWGSSNILKLAITFAIICGLALTLFCWRGFQNGSEIIVPFFLVAIANGMTYPTCMSIALNRFPEIAGTAAGLAGFLQAAIAALVSSSVAFFSHYSLNSMPQTILILSMISALVFYSIHRISALPNESPK